MTATRSPAQIEASRRNGARSKGPVTDEGKARASRNALKHGLTATQHLVLEDEEPEALDALVGQMLDETGATTEIEARLARGWPSRSGNASAPTRSRPPCSTPLPRSARPPTASSGNRPTRSPPSTSAASTPCAATRPSSPARSAAASRSCASSGRTLSPRARTNPSPCRENEPESPPAPANDDAMHAARDEPTVSENRSRNEPGSQWPTDLGANDQADSMLQPWPAGAGRSVQAAGSGLAPPLARAS